MTMTKPFSTLLLALGLLASTVGANSKDLEAAATPSAVTSEATQVVEAEGKGVAAAVSSADQAAEAPADSSAFVQALALFTVFLFLMAYLSVRFGAQASSRKGQGSA